MLYCTVTWNVLLLTLNSNWAAFCPDFCCLFESMPQNWEKEAWPVVKYNAKLFKNVFTNLFITYDPFLSGLFFFLPYFTQRVEMPLVACPLHILFILSVQDGVTVQFVDRALLANVNPTQPHILNFLFWIISLLNSRIFVYDVSYNTQPGFEQQYLLSLKIPHFFSSQFYFSFPSGFVKIRISVRLFAFRFVIIACFFPGSFKLF